ncbi:fatty acid desaturase [Acidimangrovimonas sediminis]|uniref:fatty acid desaturase n=1 Tax=Acidimangrovimonas sediminis TaxID=2056283 RepID=UPI000C80119A
MLLFTIATLIPLPLLVMGSVLGGPWALAAFAYVTLFVFLLDEVVARAASEAPEGTEFPAADRLSVVLAGAHFWLLLLAVAAVSGATGLGWGARIALFLGFGLFFGQVSNSNAHELIHRADRSLFRLGMWVYISLLFGHHTSAHRHIHHRYVATAEDPNTAELGEGFWAFAPRAWWGSFRAGAEIETAMRGRARKAKGWHPYVTYAGGSLACLAVAALLFGAGGVLAYLLLAAYAQMQLLVSDYVQHYGLERRVLPGGRSEPVGAAHSWNAGHWYSAALMLNAPRHSAHHARPATPYPALAMPAGGSAPILPHSLPVMGAIALYPPLWHRMMDKRARRWQGYVPPATVAEPEGMVPAPAGAKGEMPTAAWGDAGLPDGSVQVEPETGAQARPGPADPNAAIAEAVSRTMALARGAEDDRS